MSDKHPVGEDGYKVVVKVIQQEGSCAAGHKVGDEIVFEHQSRQGDVCFTALYSFLPKVFAMRYGATFSWEPDPDISYNACPDHLNPVVFEIRRVRD